MALVSDVDVSGGTEVIAEADTIFCIFRMKDNALRIYTVTTPAPASPKNKHFQEDTNYD